jgi:serine/threonine protein kinase
MPHLAGGSVHDALLEGYRFSIYQSIAITIDALDALAYVYRQFRALHRDTKPGNVLLDENRRHGYLSDFGSAAVIDAAGSAAALLGTNVYRPPESRLTSRVSVDADIYGIGMMLFEMLNGRLPWEELDMAVVEARLQRGLRAVPDSALSFQPHIPGRLRRCVRKAIHRDPDQRYDSAEAFIGALRKVRCIDWRHAEGNSVEGVWFGTWPPHLRPGQRTQYRVLTRVLATARGSRLISRRRPRTAAAASTSRCAPRPDPTSLRSPSRTRARTAASAPTAARPTSGEGTNSRSRPSTVRSPRRPASS